MSANNITVTEAAERPGGDVIDLMTEAYLNNAPVLAAFPGTLEARRAGNRALLDMSVKNMCQGTWLYALEDSAIVGALHYVPWPKCQPPPEALPHLGETLQVALGDAGKRVAEWFGAWAQLDPAKPHWHLGPFAVRPDRQRAGTGGGLMREYCRRMDAAGMRGYLETDSMRNVRFYEKSGFTVTQTATVLGCPNWFMERIAKAAPRDLRAGPAVDRG